MVFREVGGDNLEFEMVDNEFKITNPEGRTGYVQAYFDDFFDAVLGTKAARFVEEYEDFESLGLEPYWIKIELYKHDDVGKVNLYIGGDATDGYFANVDLREQVFVVTKEDVNAILSAVNKLR